MTKLVTIEELLTPSEIALAFELKTAKLIAEKIVKPALPRINRLTGQQNDALYLGYLFEFFILTRNEMEGGMH